MVQSLARKITGVFPFASLLSIVAPLLINSCAHSELFCVSLTEATLCSGLHPVPFFSFTSIIFSVSKTSSASDESDAENSKFDPDRSFTPIFAPFPLRRDKKNVREGKYPGYSV